MDRYDLTLVREWHNAERRYLIECVTDALCNPLLGEKIPLDISNERTGEVLINANRKITRTLLRRLAVEIEDVAIDPSPVRDKVIAIQQHFAPAFQRLETERLIRVQRTQEFWSFRLMEESAKSGDADAKFQLGCAYINGELLVKDASTGRALLMEAAGAGYTRAMLMLGSLYREEGDTRKSEEWFARAAGDGDPEGLFELSAIDRDNSTELIIAAAQKGHPTAQVRLGDLLAASASPGDQSEATEWYRRAAQQGIPEAERKLADALLSPERGMCDSDREREAARWYRKAAQKGDTEAQGKLGDCYREGRGVAKNESLAIQWFQRAGNYYMVGSIYAGLGEKRRAARAFKRAGIHHASSEIRDLGPRSTW